jgi:gamma-glutamylcyclotransferase (GGCT)/AIG2-like uncharacterized protein YtfP
VNPDSLYAFYGSLRQGMLNHDRFRHALRYLYTESIQGYRLHAMEYYPYAVRTGRADDVLVAEIYQVIDSQVEQAIHELELSVGYSYAEVMILNQSTGIYVFETSGPEPLVQGGDWVKFFGPV